jgi:hypothetical protein
VNIRSEIGLLVTRLVKERNSRSPDKYFIRRLEKELQEKINAPVEFAALPEQPHPCPPAELYHDMMDEEFTEYEKNKEENEKRLADHRFERKLKKAQAITRTQNASN